MATQKKQYDEEGAKTGVTGEPMDESVEKDFGETEQKGDIGREWDEAEQAGEGNEPVIQVELDDQGNLKEGEDE